MKSTLANSGLNGLQAGDGTTFFFFSTKNLIDLPRLHLQKVHPKKLCFIGCCGDFFFCLIGFFGHIMMLQTNFITNAICYLCERFFFFFAWRLPPAEVGGFDMFKHTGIKPCQSFEAHFVNKLGHHAQHQPCEMLSLCCR